MNNRLTIQDLAGLLAEYTGKDKESTERFLREFIAVVSEGVYADKLVKVKSLGTFKIIPVEKRESIHVNTGERFVIPEHYKFSFLPDKELRELVNKPFSFFETTELGENVDFTDIEMNSSDSEEKEGDDESVEEVVPDVELLVKEEFSLSKNPVVPEPEARLEEPEAIQPEPLQPEPLQERPVSSTKRRVGLFVLLLLVFNICVYLNRNRIFLEKEEVAVVAKDTVPIPVETVQEPVLVSDSIKPQEESTAKEEPEAASPQVIARVKIEPGSRLTLISLKYYGSKLFWVYLYEHNKAVIKDPNNVPIGTLIEVPAPELYGINRHDRSSLEKAAARQTEILSGRL